MSEYPTALHPSTTHDYNKDDQQSFTDYGCWESVDVEYTEADVAVFARKNRASKLTDDSLLHIPTDTIDGRVLAPVHDFLTIGNPVDIKALIDDNINYGDMLVLKKSQKIVPRTKRDTGSYISKKSTVMTLPVEEYITNLINDHPDVCGETFDRLSHRITKKLSGVLYPEPSLGLKNLIDFSLCDVGRKLLRNIVTEESQNDLMKRYSDRDYTGGCLSFKSIKRRKNKQYGIMVCAQGQCLDDLCIKILNINCNKQGDELCTSQLSSSGDDDHSLPLFPNMQFGPEIRQALNGRVCQIDVGGYESCDDIIIGTRSDYHVLLNKFSKSATDWNDQGTGDFCPKKCLSCLGLLKTTGGARVSSIALNPFIADECVVATEDSCVRLWNPGVDKNSDGSLENLEVLINGTLGGLQSDNPWRQVCFAAHPRQLFITDDQNVSLFDIRTQNSNMSLMNILTSQHVKQDEKIYCIENCSNIGNEYGCLVATNYNLFLMDQRFCGEPLLQWGTNMSFPPHYVRTTSISNLKRQQEFSALPHWSYSTSAVIVGNQHPQEIYGYQMCKTTRQSTGLKHFAPQAVGPARILGSFRDLRRYLKSEPSEHSEYLGNRSSKMIVGIEAIPISNESLSGMIVLQINSVGDIGYQTWCLKNASEAYDMANIITGKTSATFITGREKNRKAYLKELKRKNYEHWVTNVTETQQQSGDCDATENVCISNRFCPQHTNVSISTKSQWIDGMPSTKSCCLCLKHQDISEESDDTGHCLKCGTNSKRLTNMLENLKLRSAITLSTLESKARDIPPLNLINLDNTGNDIDNELGRLLKATWKTSYEEYWKTLRQVEEKRKVNEKLEQMRQTFDLGQRSEVNASPNLKKKKDLKRNLVSENAMKKERNSPSQKRKKTMERSPIPDSLPTTSFLSWLTSSQEQTQIATSSMNSAPNLSPTLHSSRPLPDDTFLNNEKTHSELGASGSFSAPTGSLSSPSKSIQESPSLTFFSPRKNRSILQNSSFRSPQRSFRSYHSQSEKIVPFKITKQKSLSQHSVGF